MADSSRRGFLNGVLIALGGAAAAMSPLALVGCAGETGGSAPELGDPSLQTMAIERVPLKPGMRYANVMPSRVPAVRRIPTARAVHAL